MFSFLFLYMKALKQHILERLILSKTHLLDESLNERLVLSKNRNRFVNDDEKFVLNRKSGLLNMGLEFIYEYYLKRVKIDGYAELEDIGEFNVFFIGDKIYFQRNGELTRYLITKVEDGETFREIYDRIINYLKEENIIV